MSQSLPKSVRPRERRVRHSKLRVISKPRTSISTSSTRSPRRRTVHLPKRRVRHSKLRVISKPRTSQIQTSLERRQPEPRGKIRSVNEILNQLRLKKVDLNNLGSDAIQVIFKDLTVGEISRLCSVSLAFNNVCRKESLWKEKILRDYGLTQKTRRTWRETAKEIYLERGRYWYDTLEHDLNYYFIEPNQTADPQIYYDRPNDYDFASMQYEKDFVKRALKDRKAIQATKLIFNAFYLASHYLLEDRNGFALNFMPLFRRAAEVSPGGKIPLQWMLDESLRKEVKIREFDPNAWEVAIADKDMESPIIPLTSQDYSDYYNFNYFRDNYGIVGFVKIRDSRTGKWKTVRGRIDELWSEDDYHRHLSDNKLTKQSMYNSLEIYIVPWNIANRDLYDTMAPLAELYKQYPELFVVNEDTEMGDGVDELSGRSILKVSSISVTE